MWVYIPVPGGPPCFESTLMVMVLAIIIIANIAIGSESLQDHIIYLRKVAAVYLLIIWIARSF